MVRVADPFYAYDGGMVEPMSATPSRLLLMAVHAHPDDETISMGGTLAHYAAAASPDTDAMVVTGTRGELGEIVIPERDTLEEHARLGETRLGELAAAMAALGVTRFENLGYRDSGMDGTPGNDDPRSFHQHLLTDPDGTTASLVRLVRAHRPQVLATYDDFGGYGHPDHIAAAKIARSAWRLSADPAWRPDLGAAWAVRKLYEVRTPNSVRDKTLALLESRGMNSWWSEPQDVTPEELAQWRAWRDKMNCPDDWITTKIDIVAHLAAKRRAIEAHATQIRHDGPLLGLSIEDIAAISPYEQFRLIAHRLDTEPEFPECDLFAGLR